ncbi:transcription initiation factor IIF subunit alpha-like isoform X2 [Vicia villosa]|uniref:transcription initiation factor IIF subunit alpha-like isoform X2 n=1 Tax=Vicia villosa TaxID=3911 RepID=UPI00273B45EB|nr:transcription initiation factor IIF subunit alpha-like isoform X2 [Vicia villosa]
MPENTARCNDCSTSVTRAIREPNVSATNTASGPITAEETRAFLMQKGPLPTHEVVYKFKARLRSAEDKQAFAGILKRIAKIQKSSSGTCYVILRKSSPATFGEEDADGEIIDGDGGVPHSTATKQKETKEGPVDNIV